MLHLLTMAGLDPAIQLGSDSRWITGLNPVMVEEGYERSENA